MKIVEVARKGVLTKSNLPVSDFSANPYVGCTHGCVYCYASFMKRFTNHAEPWGEFLDVKQWPEIKNPEKYAGKDIFISSVTDPYNPQEATYRRTRALLEQLKGVGVRITIQTKSDLVLRDIDLIRAFPNARVGFSINTLDEAFKDDMDRAPSIARRMDAMKALHDERIRTTCFISPIFPGITDGPAIVERVRQQCNLVWLENLNLRGSYKAAIMEYIASKRPGLLPLYEDIYVHGRRDYWEQLDVELRAYAACHDLDYVRDDDSLAKPFDPAHAGELLLPRGDHEVGEGPGGLPHLMLAEFLAGAGVLAKDETHDGLTSVVTEPGLWKRSRPWCVLSGA